jgi:hypothetical protein
MRRWLSWFLLVNFLNAALFTGAGAGEALPPAQEVVRQSQPATEDPLDSVAEYVIERLFQIPDRGHTDAMTDVELDEVKLQKRHCHHLGAALAEVANLAVPAVRWVAPATFTAHVRYAVPGLWRGAYYTFLHRFVVL